MSINTFDAAKEHFISLFNEYFSDEINYNIYQKIKIDNTIKEYHSLCEEIKCRKCYFIPLFPIICDKCKKLFCENCFDKSLKNTKKSPNNCENASKEKLNRILFNFINKFKFICIHKECGKIISFKEYLEHITICSYKKFQCKYKNCKFIGGFEECLNHSLNCGLELKECDFCNKSFFAYLLDKHIKKCEFTKCKYCSIQIKKSDLDEHIKNICPMVDEICNECKRSMKRINLKNNHTKENCLQNQVEDLKKIIVEKNKKISELEFQNSLLKEKS